MAYYFVYYLLLITAFLIDICVCSHSHSKMYIFVHVYGYASMHVFRQACTHEYVCVCAHVHKSIRVFIELLEDKGYIGIWVTVNIKHCSLRRGPVLTLVFCFLMASGLSVLWPGTQFFFIFHLINRMCVSFSFDVINGEKSNMIPDFSSVKRQRQASIIIPKQNKTKQ